MRNVLRILILAVVTMLVATACSGDDDALLARADFGGDAASATTMATSAEARSFDADSAEGAIGAPEALDDGAPQTNVQAVLTSLDLIDLGRSIIFTANIHIEVEDVIAAGAEIENALAGLGALLFGQETTTGDNPRSILTIKVRPDRFDEALDRLAGVGELVSQTVFADDVTERVIDLESRITTAAVSVERLRALLEEATTIEDVVELESELVKRETDLEVLRGQLRTLEDAVSLATIVVILTEPTPKILEPALEMVQTGYLGHDGGAGCPGNEEVTVDEGDLITICFEVTNTGDTALGDIEVRDFGLDMDEDDLVVVEGDLAVPLLPGEFLILAFEAEADPDQFTAPSIDVTALDEDGDPLRIQVEVEIEEAFLRIARDTSLPGFSDGLTSAWEALQQFFGVIVLAAGAAIPFLWVPLLAAGVWWWRKRRESDDD
ncbi:MAG: DUF4349 domain-containing protein [Acidimicrobiia bacterium]